jgi:hypothetical protein
VPDSGTPGSHEYRTIASREVFDGRIVRLRVDTLTMPGGGTADREICGHDDGHDSGVAEHLAIPLHITHG